ncbi:MAG: LicD family protein [Bacteroidales bacterium]|nr:LicD family protein [Bacteroidales bacterium]
MYSIEVIRRVQLRLLEMAVAIRNVLEKYDVPHMITYGTLLGAVRHKGFIPWDDDFDFYIISEQYDVVIDRLRNELPSDIFIEDGKSEPLYFHGWAHAKDVGTEAECELFPQDNLYAHHGVCVDLYRAFRIKKSYDKVNRLNAHLEYLQRKLMKGFLSQAEFEKKKNSLEIELSQEERKALSVNTFEDDDMIGFISVFDDSMLAEDVFPLRKYDFENTYFWGPKNADILLKRCYGDYMQLPPIEKRKPHYSKVIFK